MNKKIMTHLVCGYPNINENKLILNLLDRYSNYIEIQFPFSDPIADGPVISEANEIALKNGIKTSDCFDFIEDNILNIKSKILIMTYYNIVFNYGIDNFLKRAKNLGVYGLIVPDIPFDEKEGMNFVNQCKKNNLYLIQTISPSVGNNRLKLISEIADGFVYAISQNMTTGNKGKFGNDFKKYIKNLKNFIKIPIGVGFGIKTLDDVKKVCEIADFAIIGSELIIRYKKDGLIGLEKYLDEITN